MSTEPTVEVGTIFVRTWGYDQTNVNFYQVVEVTPSGKSVKLREIAGRVHHAEVDVPHIGKQWRTGLVALPDQFLEDDVLLKRLQVDNGRIYIAFDSSWTMSVWDGTPQYDTEALGGAGH